MKKYFFYLVLIVMSGCMSIRICHTDNDNTLVFQQNDRGEIWLSSMNSSQQIEITRQEIVGDTLFVEYKRGPYLSSVNTLNLTEEIKHLKCANRIYRVEKTVEGIRLEEDTGQSQVCCNAFERNEASQ